MFIDNPFKEVRMYCHVQPFYLNSKSPLHCVRVFFCSQSAKDPVEYLPCSLAILIIWSSVLNSGKGKTNYNFSVSSCCISSFLGNGNQACSRFGRRGLCSPAFPLRFRLGSSGSVITGTWCCWFKVLYFSQWTGFCSNLNIHNLLRIHQYGPMDSSLMKLKWFICYVVFITRVKQCRWIRCINAGTVHLTWITNF